jgi:hypothetical protein
MSTSVAGCKMKWKRGVISLSASAVAGALMVFGSSVGDDSLLLELSMGDFRGL